MSKDFFTNKTVAFAWEIFCTVVLLLFYASFAYAFGVAYLKTQSTSALSYMVFELTMVLVLMVRHFPNRVSERPVDWFSAILGTYIGLLLRPVETPFDQLFLLILQHAGIFISFAGLITLSRSFGLIAANRGIKTGGIYRFIRHPLYSGYVFAIFAFVCMNFTFWNLLVYLFFIAITWVRIRAEERFLLQDPEYKAYADNVRWRIMPFVW